MEIAKIDNSEIGTIHGGLSRASATIIEKTQELKSLVDSGKLDEETDNKIVSHMAGAKKAHDHYHAKRKIWTSKLDSIKKMFTSEEANIKSSLKECSDMRNKIATHLLAEKKKKDDEANKAVLKGNEHSELFAQAQLDSKNFVAERLASAKEAVFGFMKKAKTTEEIAKVKQTVQGMNTGFQNKYWVLGCTLVSKYENDINGIWTLARSQCYGDIKKDFEAEMQAFKQECILYCNNLGTEEAAAAIDAKVTEAKLEEESAKEINQLQADSVEQAKKAEIAFGQAAAASSNTFEAKEVVELKVTSLGGYKAITMHFFDKVAPTLDFGKLHTMSFERMRKAMEQLANKERYFIDAANGLEYSKVVKAK